MTVSPAPQQSFSTQDAERLSDSIFGVKGVAIALNSPQDGLFRLVTGTGRDWALHIMNAHASATECTFQTALLHHLASAAAGTATPRLKLSMAGQLQVTTESPTGEACVVRMMSWIPGAALSATNKSLELLGNLGRAMGNMDRALQGFTHPGALRDLPCDLRHASRMRGHLPDVPDAAQRALLERTLNRFEARIEPRIGHLRSQVIHHQISDGQVRVDMSHPHDIAGLIGFDQSVHSLLIADVASACAQAIQNMADPIGAACALTAGFHEQYPLRPEELDCLFDLIKTRLAINLAASAPHHHPAATDLVPAWQLLQRLDGMNPRFATAILRKACGFDAMEGAGEVRRWMATHAHTFEPIVRPHPARLTTAQVPYGDAQHYMTIESAAQQPLKATAWWESYCATHRVQLGLGAWGEKRTVYTSAAFESRFISGKRRMHHLGIDLFMPAGTAVHTPLAATVRSVQIEPDPLDYGGLITLLHEPKGCPPFVTLWGHMSHEAVARLKPGQPLAAGEVVGYMGEITENGGWTPHLHFQVSTDITLAAAEILGVGEAEYLGVWADLFPDPTSLAGIPAERFAAST